MLDRRQTAARMAIALHFCMHMADKFTMFFPSLSQLSSSAVALSSHVIVPFVIVLFIGSLPKAYLLLDSLSSTTI